MGIEWLVAGLVLSAISSAVGVTTSISTAKQAAALQEAEAAAQADSLRSQAEQEEQDQMERSLVARKESRQRLAAAEANYGASGVTMSGTPVLALGNFAEDEELEIRMQESASEYKRELLLTDADNAETFGNASAALTYTSGMYNAVGTGLSGAASITSGVYTGYQDGVF